MIAPIYLTHEVAPRPAEDQVVVGLYPSHRIGPQSVTTSVLRASGSDTCRAQEPGGQVSAAPTAPSPPSIPSADTSSSVLGQPLRILETWLEGVVAGDTALPRAQVDPILALARKERDSTRAGLALAALALSLPTHRVAELADFVQPTENGLHATQAMLTIACAAPVGDVDQVMPRLRAEVARLRKFDFSAHAETPHLGRAIEAHLLALDALLGGDVSMGPRRIARLLLQGNAEVTSSERAASAARLLG